MMRMLLVLLLDVEMMNLELVVVLATVCHPPVSHRPSPAQAITLHPA